MTELDPGQQWCYYVGRTGDIGAYIRNANGTIAWMDDKSSFERAVVRGLPDEQSAINLSLLARTNQQKFLEDYRY